MVTVNEYALLYNSEVSEKSKQILIKKIKEELKYDIKKIISFWCFEKLKPTDDKHYYFEEFKQIADMTLLSSLNKFDINKSKNFKAFFILCLKSDLKDHKKEKSKKIGLDLYSNKDIIGDIPKLIDDDIIEITDNNIDRKFLRDKLLLYIDNINFNLDIQKEIFLEVSGIKKNFKWKSLEEYGEIIGYTKQNISKTYNKYLKILSDMINKDKKVKEEFRQFL